MKKIITILALTISAGAFAMNHTNHGEMTSNSQMNHSGHGMMSQVANLTPEKQAEYNEFHAKHRVEMQKTMLDIKEIDLKIQKEMTAQTPNQDNINKLIDQKAKLQADRQKDMLKFRLDAKEKFGVEMRGMNCKMMGKHDSKEMDRSVAMGQGNHTHMNH